jgi:hypothetical protein
LPAPLPLAGPVICIQLTSLNALHPQPVPVVMAKRLSLAVASAVALVAESEKLEGEPSWATVLVNGVASPLPFRTRIPLRDVTQPFPNTVNGTEALVMPPAVDGGTLTQLPTLLLTAQAQLAVTCTAPFPPAIEKFCDEGEKLKLQTAASWVMVTIGLGRVVFSVRIVMLPLRVWPMGFASAEKVKDPDPVTAVWLAVLRCNHEPAVIFGNHRQVAGVAVTLTVLLAVAAAGKLMLVLSIV